MAPPAPVTDLVGEGPHPGEHILHSRDDILAIDLEGVARRGSQRHMEDRPAFGGVDPVAAKHRFDAIAESELFGQSAHGPEDVVIDTLLGIIENQPAGFCRVPLAPSGIGGKQIPEEAGACQLPALGCEVTPGGKVGKRGLRHGIALKSTKRVLV